MLTRGVDEILSLARDLGVTETMRSVGAALAVLVRDSELERGHNLAIPKHCLEDAQDGYEYVLTKRNPK